MTKCFHNFVAIDLSLFCKPILQPHTMKTSYPYPYPYPWFRTRMKIFTNFFATLFCKATAKAHPTVPYLVLVPSLGLGLGKYSSPISRSCLGLVKVPYLGLGLEKCRLMVSYSGILDCDCDLIDPSLVSNASVLLTINVPFKWSYGLLHRYSKL